MNTQATTTYENPHYKYFATSQCVATLDALKDFIDQATRSRDARMASIRGPSRVGKSALIDELCAAYPRSNGQSAAHHPILYVKVPAQPTIKVLLAQCLRLLGAPTLTREAAPEMLSRLAHFIKACGVRLIIFDEFQHLLRVRGTTQDGLCDTIKSILNDCKCPVLAVGAPDSLSVITYDPQLDGRCILRRELKPFDGWKPEPPKPQNNVVVPAPSFVEFQRVVKAMVKAHGFPEASGIEIGENVQSLYIASKGLFGRLVDLIDRAALDSKKAGLPKISGEILQNTIVSIRGEFDAEDEPDLADEIENDLKRRKRPKRAKHGKALAIAQQAVRNKLEG